MHRLRSTSFCLSLPCCLMGFYPSRSHTKVIAIYIHHYCTLTYIQDEETAALWKYAPKVYCGWPWLLMDTIVVYLLLTAIAIDGRYYWSIAKTNGYRWIACTMAVDRHPIQSTVAGNGHRWTQQYPIYCHGQIYRQTALPVCCKQCPLIRTQRQCSTRYLCFLLSRL